MQTTPSPGYLGGLHLVLNAEQHDYIFYDIGYGSDAGFLINIHDPDAQYLRPADTAYLAPAGSATRISLQREEVYIHRIYLKFCNKSVILVVCDIGQTWLTANSTGVY